MEQDPDHQPYRLYTDPSLLAAAEKDTHLAIQLRGLEQTTKLAEEFPDNHVYRKTADAAEISLRDLIKRIGYSTQEPPKSENGTA